MKELSAELKALAKKQSGVLHLRQLHGWYSRGAIRANVRAGRWRHIGHGAYALTTGNLTFGQRAWAALLVAAPGSALSGPTALRVDGLDVRGAGVDQTVGVHVTLPPGAHRVPLPGVVTHWSTHLGLPDVHDTREPRRTRLPRSVVDTAAWHPSPTGARAVVLIAIQRGLVSTDQIDDALARRGSCRHHGEIAEAADDARGGITSVPEWAHKVLLRRFQLPEPTRQVVRRRKNGRAYLDADWEPYGVSSEIEGVLHFEPDQRERDMDRLNELTIAGDRVLLFTSYAVRHRQEHVAEVIARALITGGWQPPRTNPWAPLAQQLGATKRRAS